LIHQLQGRETHSLLYAKLTLSAENGCFVDHIQKKRYHKNRIIYDHIIRQINLDAQNIKK